MKNASPARTARNRNGASRNGNGSDRPRSATSNGNVNYYTWPYIYEAADRRDFRGYFYFPNLNPTDQLNSLTRRAIMERVDWLYKNVGAVRMVIDGLASDEAGTGLWPKWNSSDAEYNAWMTDAFHFTNHDPRFFSADAHNNYYGVQFNIRRAIRLYGDCFGQFIRPGAGFHQPRMHLLAGYLVDNCGREKPDSGWIDGTHADKFGRIDKFRVLDKERGGDTDFQDVDAEDLLHFHDDFLPGQRRGAPALASVVKKMFRREDIGRALANGTLARERIGYAIESKDDSGAGPRFATPGANETNLETKADGNKVWVLKFYGESGLEDVPVPELSNGKQLKTVESNRPGTQVMEYLDSVLREVAWDTMYPPEYVFFIGGMGQGTVARLVLQRVKTVIYGKRERQLISQFCNRYNVFYAWQRIRSGSIPSTIKIPEDWWKHKIIQPPDSSVDIAREGKLWDDRVSRNLISIPFYHGLNGEDDDDVENENLRVIKRRIEKLDKLNKDTKQNFTYFDLWPRSINNAPTSGDTPDPNEPPQPQTPPKK